MIVHQAVGRADPVVALVDVLEGIQEIDAIPGALEDGLSLVAPGSDGVDCTAYSLRSGRGISYFGAKVMFCFFD